LFGTSAIHQRQFCSIHLPEVSALLHRLWLQVIDFEEDSTLIAELSLPAEFQKEVFKSPAHLRKSHAEWEESSNSVEW
jgi:hypothetical protein